MVEKNFESQEPVVSSARDPRGVGWHPPSVADPRPNRDASQESFSPDPSPPAVLQTESAISTSESQRPAGPPQRAVLTVLLVTILVILSAVGLFEFPKRNFSIGFDGHPGMFSLAADSLAIFAVIWSLWRGRTPADQTPQTVRCVLGLTILAASFEFISSFLRTVKYGISGGDLIVGGAYFVVDLLAIFTLIWFWRGINLTTWSLTENSPTGKNRNVSQHSQSVRLQTDSARENSSPAPSVQTSGPAFPLSGEVHGLQGYAKITENGWRFRLQCYDDAGNPLTPLPVEIPIGKDKGGLFEGDRVEVYGEWQGGTGVRASRIRNLATGIVTEAAHFKVVVWVGYVLQGVGGG